MLQKEIWKAENMTLNYSEYVHTGNVSVVYAPDDLSQQNQTAIDARNVSNELNCTAVLEGTSGPPPAFNDVERYILSGILFIFPCLTMLGNGMVVVAVLTHKSLQTVTNAFVVSLAVADIMVAILVMPFGIYQQFNNKVWNLSRALCLVTTSFDVMFTTTSIFNLSCLAIDRYLAICKPFTHERLTRLKVILMLSFCWIVPIFISFLPIMNNWNHIGIEDYIECAFPENDLTHCTFVVNKVFATVCSMIAFYIPAVFIIICNVHIFRAARKQAYQIRSIELSAHKHHRKGKLKHETKAAKTVGIIMGSFFICWFPFFGLNIVDPFIGYKIPYNLWSVALWLGYIYSMLNPFLYYNFNRKFKKAFLRLLTGQVCRGVSEFSYDTVAGNVYTDMSHSATAKSHDCLNKGAGSHSEPSNCINNNVEL